ncbi:hypothetical protein HJB80_22310 [Rhizobium lentis]|nr:hypothetical protein [Rhizobium lentis]
MADDDHLHIEAFFGLNEKFSNRVVPNYALDDRNTHEEKAARVKALWPEGSIHHWWRGCMISAIFVSSDRRLS